MRFFGNRFTKMLLSGGIPQQLIDLIRQYGGVISGSKALQMFDSSIVAHDIDIYMPQKVYSCMEKYFSKSKIWHSRFEKYDYNKHGVSMRRVGNVIDHRRRITPFYIIVEYVLIHQEDDDYKYNKYQSYRGNHTNNIQIIYMKNGIDIKKHIRATYDLDVLKNYYDGKVFTANFINDITTKQTHYHMSNIVTQLPITYHMERINKYKDRGYISKNITTTTYQLYDIDNVIDKVTVTVTKMNNEIIQTDINKKLAKYLTIYHPFSFPTYEALFRDACVTIMDLKHKYKRGDYWKQTIYEAIYNNFAMSLYELKIKYNIIIHIGKQLGYRFTEDDINLCNF